MKNPEYIKYRSLWDNAGTLPLRRMPVHLDLELTSRCNLSCVMCPHSKKDKGFKLGDMQLKTAKNLLREGKGIIKSVKLNWRGEPTLYKYLPEVIFYAKDLGYVEVMINTNLNCSQKYLKDVINAGIDKIIVSIDSLQKEIYEKIRKGGKMQLVLDNVAFLKSTNRKVDIVIQARRQKFNQKEIFPKWIEVKPATKRTKNGDYLLHSRKIIGRQNCLMPFRRLLISFDGQAFGCCADWFEKNPVGNIRQGESLSEIWKGAKINKLRKDLESGKAYEYEPCKSCFSRESYKWKK